MSSCASTISTVYSWGDFVLSGVLSCPLGRVFGVEAAVFLWSAHLSARVDRYSIVRHGVMYASISIVSVDGVADTTWNGPMDFGRV